MGEGRDSAVAGDALADHVVFEGGEGVACFAYLLEGGGILRFRVKVGGGKGFCGRWRRGSGSTTGRGGGGCLRQGVIIWDLDTGVLSAGERPGGELGDGSVHVFRGAGERKGGGDVAEVVPDLELDVCGFVSVDGFSGGRVFTKVSISGRVF